MNIGTNIYNLRKQKKFTQAQLAEKLGVSEQAVSKWENGVCIPDVSIFPVMADIFGVSIDRIFGYHKKSYTDEVEGIMKRADESKNTYSEIEIISEGLKRFPNSPELKTYLSFSLLMLYRTSEEEKEQREAVNKAIKLCNEVVDSCNDTKQLDGALNMLRRIYCEIGEYSKALEAVERISAEGFRRKIIGKAQILQYSGAHNEFNAFTENNLFECFLLIDALFELKRIELTKNRDHKKLVSWCNAHEKLLSCFDEGCSSFYACHKLWVCEAKARAYKNLKDKNACLTELKNMISLSKAFDADAMPRDYQIAVRNPLFFSTVTDPGIQEEFMSEIDLKMLLSGYDDFFGEDEDYVALKAEI
ncbi:MAG: helix-turn-helix transcriptional regulator [Ruminococcaceae bacterium]|nr:helix-turn-helix transcriptional regulator [Oscillospiraceae bacterium]